MYPELEGKVAVVTGAATGLGKAIATRFLQEKMKVVMNYLTDNQEKAVQDVIDQYKGEDGKPNAIAVKGDITNSGDIEKLYHTAIDNFGRLDQWVNNAGVENRVPTHEMSEDDWNTVLNINLTGVFLGTKMALNHFVGHGGGNIINMSSVHEKIPWPTFAHYTASKSGVNMFSKTVAMEYAKRNIRCNCLAPGAIETEINAQNFAIPANREKTQSMIPMDKIGQPEQVAAAAAFLASDQSSYVTGISLFVDGGMSLYPSFEKGDG